MNKEYLVDLTKKLYRLTLLFPKKEPLRYKMREFADEILINYQKCEFGKNFNQEETCQSLLEYLDILDCFFEIIKEQKWVKLEEISIIQEGYEKLVHEIKSKRKFPLLPKENKIEYSQPKQPQEIVFNRNNQQLTIYPQQINYNFVLRTPNNQSQNLSERQEKILAFLREKGKVQVWQIKQLFPDVTKRTLRRDFERLLRKGVIERVGERSNTFYQIKIS